MVTPSLLWNDRSSFHTARRPSWLDHCRAVGHRSIRCLSQRKKPTWPNTRRYSTTSAYSLSSLLVPVTMRQSHCDQPSCSLFSHPTNSSGSASEAIFNVDNASLPCLMLSSDSGMATAALVLLLVCNLLICCGKSSRCPSRGGFT